MDGGADELDRGRDSKLCNQDLEILLRGKRVWDGSGYHRRESEGPEDSQSISKKECGVGGQGDSGAAD